MESLKTATESYNCELHMCPGINVCSSNCLRPRIEPISVRQSERFLQQSWGTGCGGVSALHCWVKLHCRHLLPIFLHWQRYSQDSYPLVTHCIRTQQRVLLIGTNGFTNGRSNPYSRAELYHRRLSTFTVPPIQYRIGVDTLGMLFSNYQ